MRRDSANLNRALTEFGAAFTAFRYSMTASAYCVLPKSADRPVSGAGRTGPQDPGTARAQRQKGLRSAPKDARLGNELSQGTRALSVAKISPGRPPTKGHSINDKYPQLGRLLFLESPEPEPRGHDAHTDTKAPVCALSRSLQTKINVSAYFFGGSG